MFTIPPQIGRSGCNWGGRPPVLRYGRYVLIKADHLETAERWLDRWGALASFVTRLLPVVRTFSSLPAGVVRSPFISFAILTVAGLFFWSLGLAWLGYVLGNQFEQVRNSIGWLDYPIIALVVLLIGWFIYSSVKKSRGSRATGKSVENLE